jgi:hypothetical protein
MRLNAAVRSEITHNATKVLLEREKALEAREQLLAARCYVAAYPVQLRHAFQGVIALSKAEFFKTRRDIRYNVAGQGVVLVAKDFLVVPHQYYVYNENVGVAITLKDNEKLVTDVRAWQADKEQFTKDKSLAQATLKTMLKSVGSTDSLFKIWPEGKKFYSSPPLTPQVKTGVPAVQMQALNSMLGLSA